MKIEDFVKQVNKKYGANTVVRFGETPNKEYGKNVIPTGSLTLDTTLGIGGYPRGRIIHLYGNAGSGKTTLCLHAIYEAQKMGLNTLYIDAENSLDVFYARSIGVDVNEMYILQPDYGEQAFYVANEAVGSGAIGLVVVDSVAALVPKRELEGDVGDSHVGLQARMMSQACRMMTGVLARNNVTAIFVNQLRANVSTAGFGAPGDIPTGGKALDYYASVIMKISRIQGLKDNDEASGHRAKVEVRKNKLSAPYRTAEFDILYGTGVDKWGEIVDLAERFGIITKTGAWYKDGDKSVAQGKSNMAKLLEGDVEYGSRIKNAVQRRAIGGLVADGEGDSGVNAGGESSS